MTPEPTPNLHASWKQRLPRSEYRSRVVFFVVATWAAIILDAAVWASAGFWPAAAAGTMWVLGVIAWQAIYFLEQEDRRS